MRTSLFYKHNFIQRLRDNPMPQETGKLRKPSNAYNIFILVLTVLSLAVMVVMLLPFISEETMKLLSVYDNLICVIFLIDFYLNLRGAAKKSDYFIKERGWLDLLGSIPSLGLITNAGKFVGLLRLARLSRLARIARLLRGENKKALVKDILENRSRYATFLTILLTLLVLTVSSVLVLQFESKSPDANITIGRGRVVVFDRDHHHGGIWRLLSGNPMWDELPPCSSCSWGSASSAPWPAFSPACWLGDRLRLKRKPRLLSPPPLSKKSLPPSRVSWRPCTKCWRKWPAEDSTD